MQDEHISGLTKARYYSSVTCLYLLTLLFALYIFRPLSYPGAKVLAAKTPAAPSFMQIKQITSGKPVRVVIPSVGIDLPVDEGVYNPTDNSWTLSGYHAQFATLSSLANDNNGNTFIYGHNNKYVFGPIKQIVPGALAEVYTDNNHVFSYNFEATTTFKPDDTTIFDYRGPSILTIQTCSGVWNEQRQMYKFDFARVE
jgi:LPXTG-site transpeptidase (sortase) family protein